MRWTCEEVYKTIDINRTKLKIDTQQENLEYFSEPITSTEKKVILQLNKGKTPGPDGLPAEFYQIFNQDISEFLEQIYNEGIEEKAMHKSFYHTIISLIYKKGDKSEIDNYRHMS